MNNFIIVYLCDNDFGYAMEKALEEGLFEYSIKQDPKIWKLFIIEYVISYSKKKYIVHEWTPRDTYEDDLRSYFTNNLRVEFTRKGPEGLDHDGGSVYADLHSGEIYRF